MKNNTSHRRPALLAFSFITLGSCALMAQKPESPPAVADIEGASIDPVASEKPSAEMLDSQASALFARGETEKAIALQRLAVEQAKLTLTKATENLARYEGRPANDGPLARKLREIIIPRMDFEDVTLEEAVDFLRSKAQELDAVETDPAKKGINIVIAPIPKAKADPFVKPPLNKGEIDLRLRNVPLGVALKFICDQTGRKYEIDDNAVIISPVEPKASAPQPSKK